MTGGERLDRDNPGFYLSLALFSEANGGRKGSSYGPREQGRYAREFYTIVKTAYSFDLNEPS